MYDDTCDNPQMITDSKHTECLTCGFYLNADMIEFGDMIAEIERAYQYAYQYRVNTIRIRRLLSNNPVTTWDNCLINWSTGKMLINPNPDIPYIDDSLIIS